MSTKNAAELMPEAPLEVLVEGVAGFATLQGVELPIRPRRRSGSARPISTAAF